MSIKRIWPLFLSGNSTGELIIHHKKGTRRYYDISEKYIQPSLLNASEPLEVELEHHKWRVLRRIGSVGLFFGIARQMHG
ncbi:hypothetical protein [Paenibacillus sambharensis]|uniref:hypothetical protein n=1 Tax=Paenibacillus sambharensis TaxID=1803190 RepID=UPI001FEB00E8|nr:hypothetical protein [Paenibacillus sambharensis]